MKVFCFNLLIALISIINVPWLLKCTCFPFFYGMNRVRYQKVKPPGAKLSNVTNTRPVANNTRMF